MNKLPEEIQCVIFRYKHQLEFTNVLKQLVRYHNEPKIYFCSRCCEFYPMWMKCDCVDGAHNDDDNDADWSYFSDDDDWSGSSNDDWMDDL